MRSKVKVHGMWYRPVPWLAENDCEGCGLNTAVECLFNTHTNEHPCDAENEFAGKILIRTTEEAYEKYAVAAVKAKFDKAQGDKDE